MITCTKCVLNEKFPGISFDQHGVCNYCRTQKDQADQQKQKAQYYELFLDLIEQYRGNSEYDCIVAYSGGKDSTFTLHLLKKQHRLKILALTFDNGYQSVMAARNVRAVLRNMNIDHYNITPRYDLMKAVILASISKDLHSMKALMRSSSICTSCISLIRFAVLKTAIEKQIPFVVFGLSPGQAPIKTSIVETNAGMLRMMQKISICRIKEHAGEDLEPFFLDDRHFTKDNKYPISINPLAFIEYDEEKIYKVVQQYRWSKPDDTDANSTNCLLNALANQVHIDHFGFNPYAYEIAELVRTGRMTRREGLSRLTRPQSREHIQQIREDLGLTENLSEEYKISVTC